MATVDVTVENHQPVCDPDVLAVQGKNITVNWKMKDDGWRIVGVSGLPSTVFQNPGKNGKGYKIKNKGTPGEWNYTVILQADGSSDSPTISADPSIRNLPDL